MTSSPRDWRRLGLDIVRAVVLSRHGAGRAFRLDLRDGRTLKARLFTSPRWAADVERLLAARGARACPRPIERHGNVLISEFVPGFPSTSGWRPRRDRKRGAGHGRRAT
jgi:hypothetical protein